MATERTISTIPPGLPRGNEVHSSGVTFSLMVKYVESTNYKCNRMLLPGHILFPVAKGR